MSLKDYIGKIPAEQKNEASGIIAEIIKENDIIVPSTGGKSHRQIRRRKWSTPRRRRNSRVKSMKPKKRAHRRKTKSVYKKRETKKR
jgi:hypothetical protein